MRQFNYEEEVAEMITKYSIGKMTKEVLINNIVHLDRFAEEQDKIEQAYIAGRNDERENKKVCSSCRKKYEDDRVDDLDRLVEEEFSIE